MLKRSLDISLALFGLVLLSPLLLLIAIGIVLDSRGGIIYKQERIGKGEEPFALYKLRTMRPNSDRKGLLTVGNRDQRITRIGYYLRRYKLDELPQLWNVVEGTMSLVGPRPEVRRYVELYNPEQRRVLEVRPGITDYASLAYINENELLAQSEEPERTYIEEVMPRKLALNLKYIEEQSFGTDVKILLKTVGKILR